MEEEYVSFEVAKLLKGKGFDLYCDSFYLENGVRLLYPFGWTSNIDVLNYLAPTLYITQKWLREEKEIHIVIDVCASGYYAVIWKTNGTFIKTLADKGPNDGGVWDIYEEALNAGIMKALKFI